MTEIFVIAEEELIIPFRMIGVGGEALAGAESALAAFRRATGGPASPAGSAGSSGCRMLILTEDIADMLGPELVEWQLLGRYPLVVEIPPLSGSMPDHVRLVDAVRQAIGIKIQ